MIKKDLTELTKDILTTAEKYGVSYIFDNGRKYRVVYRNNAYIVASYNIKNASYENITFDIITSLKYTNNNSIISFLEKIESKKEN